MRVEDLQKLKEQKLSARLAHPMIRVGVCYAMGGIAAGAEAVMDAIADELASHPEVECSFVRIGCIGICSLDPIVDVSLPGEDKVTYVKMTPDKARRMVREHVIGKRVVTEFTLHIAGEVILNDFPVIDG